jgi:hypothetical protein
MDLDGALSSLAHMLRHLHTHYTILLLEMGLMPSFEELVGHDGDLVYYYMIS